MKVQATNGTGYRILSAWSDRPCARRYPVDITVCQSMITWREKNPYAEGLPVLARGPGVTCFGTLHRFCKDSLQLPSLGRLDNQAVARRFNHFYGHVLHVTGVGNARHSGTEPTRTSGFILI